MFCGWDDFLTRGDETGAEAGAKCGGGLHEQRASRVQHQDAHDPERASEGPQPQRRELGAVLAQVPQKERPAQEGKQGGGCMCWGQVCVTIMSLFLC